MPVPVKPVSHVQVKLPAVLAHVALSWQSSVLVVHSSISATRDLMRYGNTATGVLKRLTFAVRAVSAVSLIASAIEIVYQVRAVGVGVARITGAFIVLCEGIEQYG